MMMIDMLALISVAATLLTAVEAQTAAEPTTRMTIISNSTTDTASSGIELSQQPVLQERTTTVQTTSTLSSISPAMVARLSHLWHNLFRERRQSERRMVRLQQLHFKKL